MSNRIAARIGAYLLAFSCLLAGLAQAAPPQRWTFVDLGAFGTFGSSPGDLNNRGDVVGSSFVNSIQRHHAFLWQNGVLNDMGAALGNPPGSASSTLVRITDRGAMLGYIDQVPHLWHDGAITGLPLDFATDINRSGDIVGAVSIFVGGFQSFANRAVLYRDGVVHDLGTLGGNSSSARAINDRGVIIGNSKTASGASHGFVWEKGVMQDLGTLGGPESVAEAINSHGVIVGRATEASGRIVAVMWTRFGIHRLMDEQTAALDINDRGQILISAPGNMAYLYEDGKLTRLDNLPEVTAAGVIQLSPIAINDRGWIVGLATRRAANGDPVATAFLLIPR